MREIIFKNFTTRNNHRRDLWMHEITDENGLHAEIQKRCVYLVRNRIQLPDAHAVDRWIREHTDDPRCRLRNLTVTRRENSKDGTKEFFFKAIGSFFAVMGEEIFLIRFIQTYEVSLVKSLEEEGETWT